jgi:phage shock protein PspC (stress-responsive transcriptional regulator)
MTRNLNDQMLGGVLSGIANSLGISTGLLRVIFIVLYLGIGGITLGISAGAMTIIYILLWMFIPGSS